MLESTRCRCFWMHEKEGSFFHGFFLDHQFTVSHEQEQPNTPREQSKQEGSSAVRNLRLGQNSTFHGVKTTRISGGNAQQKAATLEVVRGVHCSSQ